MHRARYVPIARVRACDNRLVDVADEIWAQIDAELLQGSRATAIKLLHDTYGGPLRDAIILVGERVTRLMEAHPEALEGRGEFYS